MGANSNRKGKAGELALANKLSELLPDLDEIKRGLSQCRGGGAEEPDVVGLPAMHIECKRQKMPNIRAALRQAVRDAKDDTRAVAITRGDRDGWLCTMHLEDWAAMYDAAQAYWALCGRIE